MDSNMVTWFEIAVSDMNRAKMFYETVFGIKIHTEEFGSALMGWFPFSDNNDSKGASGALVLEKNYYKPSANGTLVYFSSQVDDVDDELSRIEKAGGILLQGKTLITEEIGYMGLFLDTEGNKIAIHSRK